MSGDLLRWAGGNLLRFAAACGVAWLLAVAWYAVPVVPAEGPFPGVGGYLSALMLSPVPLWLPHLVVVGLLSRVASSATFRVIAVISALTLGGLWWPVHVSALGDPSGWLAPTNVMLPAAYALYGAVVRPLPAHAV